MLHIREKNGNIFILAQFEEGGLSSETRDDAESGNKSDNNSAMPTLISEEEMDAMDSDDESDDDPISTQMLEDIRDGSKSHPEVNRIEARYKIRDCIRQRQPELKGALRATLKMGKVLHKVFETVVQEILQDLPPLGESGSEVSHFILESRNSAKVTKLSDDIRKH